MSDKPKRPEFSADDGWTANAYQDYADAMDEWLKTEVLPVLQGLIRAADDYHDSSSAHFCDTDYDRDGVLAELDAILMVTALPHARALTAQLEDR